MDDKNYVVAVLLTIPATSYKAALRQAEEIGEELAQDAAVMVDVVIDYEHDNDGQRVVHLHSEDKPEE